MKSRRLFLMLGLLVATALPAFAVDDIDAAASMLTNEISRMFAVLLPYAIGILGLFIGWKLIRRMVKSGISG